MHLNYILCVGVLVLSSTVINVLLSATATVILVDRYNANGLDLNRNFPDYFVTNQAEVQMETKAVMDWLKRFQFVLSANLHGGTMVANYPYDNLPGGQFIIVLSLCVCICLSVCGSLSVCLYVFVCMSFSVCVLSVLFWAYLLTV